MRPRLGRQRIHCRSAHRLACVSHLFIAIQGETNLLLFKPALGEKARLAGSFPHILRRIAAEAFVAYGERLRAPPRAIHFHELLGQRVADATLAQLVANFQRSLPARHAVRNEALGESPIGEKIFGFERVQCLADQRLGESTLRELAPELGARVFAARQ